MLFSIVKYVTSIAVSVALARFVIKGPYFVMKSFSGCVYDKKEGFRDKVVRVACFCLNYRHQVLNANG